MGCFQRQQPALSRVQAGAERPSPLHLGTITSPCCASCCPWESRPWPSVCSRSYTVRSPAPPGWRECLMPPTVSPWGRTLVFHTSRGGLSHPPHPAAPREPVKEIHHGRGAEKGPCYVSPLNAQAGPGTCHFGRDGDSQVAQNHVHLNHRTAWRTWCWCRKVWEALGGAGPAPRLRAGCLQQEKHRHPPSALFDGF